MLKKLHIFLIVVNLTVLAACSGSTIDNMNQESLASPEKSTGQIFLYGEWHGIESIMNKQLELWYEYYHYMGMRHLFIEVPYFSAEFLNIWMQSDGDDILYDLFNDLEGTLAHVPYTLAFYRTIKSEFPETIFHGTDIGHQFGTTGERFMKHLIENNMQGTEQYLLAQKAIEQGRYFYIYSNLDIEYRVAKKTENFIREFDKLADQNVMGIFGANHTAFGIMYGRSFPTLAEQLRERYGDAVHSKDLSWMAPQIELIREYIVEPMRVDIKTISGIDYEASYFGEQDLTGFRDFVSRRFWRLENAYYDFRDKTTTGDWLPFDNYPMLIEIGQVFVIDYTMTDGSVSRVFFRSDGNYWHGLPATDEFIP